MNAVRDIPRYADLAWWEDDVVFVPHQDDTRIGMTVWTDDMRSGCDSIHARLFVGEKFVAAARVLGPGNFDKQDANVLCFVEVHPEHRGNQYSRVLIEMLRDQIGEIWRTGTFSVSGYANSKHLDLPICHGREPHVTNTVEYHFVDWVTGEYRT